MFFGQVSTVPSWQVPNAEGLLPAFPPCVEATVENASGVVAIDPYHPEVAAATIGLSPQWVVAMVECAAEVWQS